MLSKNCYILSEPFCIVASVVQVHDKGCFLCFGLAEMSSMAMAILVLVQGSSQDYANDIVVHAIKKV